MNPDLANTAARAMRRRIIRRKRAERLLSIVHNLCAAAGFLFIVGIVFGLLG